MKIDLLKNYINKLDKSDIERYLNKENITYNNNELDLIYNLIKNDNDTILHSNFNEYILNYKDRLNQNLYNKILEKYNEYKKFIE